MFLYFVEQSKKIKIGNTKNIDNITLLKKNWTLIKCFNYDNISHIKLLKLVNEYFESKKSEDNLFNIATREINEIIKTIELAFILKNNNIYKIKKEEYLKYFDNINIDQKLILINEILLC